MTCVMILRWWAKCQKRPIFIYFRTKNSAICSCVWIIWYINLGAYELLGGNNLKNGSVWIIRIIGTLQYIAKLDFQNYKMAEWWPSWKFLKTWWWIWYPSSHVPICQQYILNFYPRHYLQYSSHYKPKCDFVTKKAVWWPSCIFEKFPPKVHHPQDTLCKIWKWCYEQFLRNELPRQNDGHVAAILDYFFNLMMDFLSQYSYSFLSTIHSELYLYY